MTHEEAVSTLAPERYLLEEMSGSERETFEEHYFSCVECADDVRTGGVMRDGVRAGLMKRTSLVNDAGRAKVIRGPWYQSSVIPWAAPARAPGTPPQRRAQRPPPTESRRTDTRVRG